MAENKKSFLLYCDTIHSVEQLTDVKAGQLFKHLLRYVNDKNPETDDIIIKLAFEPIKQQLKRDLKKYENIRKKNKENIEKRWAEKKEKIPNHTTVYDRIPNDTKHTDNDSDIVLPNGNNNLSVNWSGLVEQFNEITGKKIRLVNHKAKGQIKARLKEGYTKADILTAIENCYKDKFHMENNHQHLTLEFISRADKLERYCTMKPTTSLQTQDRL